MHLEATSDNGRYIARIYVTGNRTAKAEVQCVKNGRTEVRRFRCHSWRAAESEAIQWAKSHMARLEHADHPAAVGCGDGEERLM